MRVERMDAPLVAAGAYLALVAVSIVIAISGGEQSGFLAGLVTLPWSALFVLLLDLGGSNILETAVGGPVLFVVGGAINAWLIVRLARRIT